MPVNTNKLLRQARWVVGERGRVDHSDIHYEQSIVVVQVTATDDVFEANEDVG